MAFTLVQLSMLDLFCETLLYGCFCVIMVAVLHILAASRSLLPTHRNLLAISVIQYILVTAHIILTLLAHMEIGVSVHQTQASAAIAQILVGLSGIIGKYCVDLEDLDYLELDSVCCRGSNPDHDSSFVVGIRSVTAITSTSSLVDLLPSPTRIFAVVNTSLCTCLIAGRIAFLQYRTTKIPGRSRGVSFSYIFCLIVESGAVLGMANIVSLVLEKLSNVGSHVVLNMLAPLFGIVTTLIVILSHLDLIPGNHANDRYHKSVVGTQPEARGPTTFQIIDITSPLPPQMDLPVQSQ
ncbi:hypothetical protein A0H81_12694 [Grifola frondosa]|uniref:Uncharacterized protein n=1 Tax=Grifola frondosa TaxID=5627 RepID=A0A1C7LRI4_GRIFR|nr:hypothetical protein A0H81_12694 [Grifola frondosa]